MIVSSFNKYLVALYPLLIIDVKNGFDKNR